MGRATLPRLILHENYRVGCCVGPELGVDSRRDRSEAPTVVLAGNGGEIKPSNRAKELGLKMAPVSVLNLDLT